MGLSISAPIFFIIALEIFLGLSKAWEKEYEHWRLLAVFIWIEVIISALFNGLVSGGINFDRDSALNIFRYAYWLLVFFGTLIFVSQAELGAKVASVLGWSVFILALLRWAEVLIYGNIGAWTGTHLMRENDYGFTFSMFAPFLLVFIN